MFGQSRGFDIIARNKAGGRIEVVEKDAPVAVKQLSTIDDAHSKAKALVTAMENRKAYWEDQIRIASEELRQAGIVLIGAYQLLNTIEDGKKPDTRPQVHDEVDMSSSSNDFDDFEKLVGILKTPPGDPGAATGATWEDVLK